MSPASGSGFTATMTAPFSFARSRWVNMRGALVPGFWPAMTISSACSTKNFPTSPITGKRSGNGPPSA